MPKPKTITVDRTKWARGNIRFNSLLVNSSLINLMGQIPDADMSLPAPTAGKMCCLGFACLGLGMTSTKIAGKAYPASTGVALPKELSNANLMLAMAKTNDAAGLTNAQRETSLNNTAFKAGFQYKFVN